MPVDLQEKRQLDLAGQVAKVKAHTRPWRAIIALVLAVAAAIVSAGAGRNFGNWSTTDHVVSQVVNIAAALAFCLLAIAAVVGFASRARDAMQPVTGRAHAAVVRYAIVLAGSITALIITLGLLKVPLEQLLVGGAVTSIILGIAAQQSLSNVFSGIVLLLSHPFGVGDAVHVRSGAMGGPIDGIVTEVGISYVSVETAEGLIHLPNSQVLASAVGPAREPPVSPPTAAGDAPGTRPPTAADGDAPGVPPSTAATGDPPGTRPPTAAAGDAPGTPPSTAVTRDAGGTSPPTAAGDAPTAPPAS